MKPLRIVGAVAAAGLLSAAPFTALAATSPYPPKPPTPAQMIPGQMIPETGSESGSFLQVGALLIGAGAIAVVASRRRSTAGTPAT